MSIQLLARSSMLGSRTSARSLITSILSKPAPVATTLPASPEAALIYRSFVHRALSSAASLSGAFPACASSVRPFSTRPVSSSLNDANPNWSNRPPKETILLDGCDFEHWLVVMEKPEGDPTRAEIIDSYIKTLAMVVGSEEEARMKIYSVSTRCYFAFGALVSEELSYKLKELPRVRWVLPDSYLNVKEKDYGGEPFINGEAVPYDPKYHEEWERNNQRAMERNRRNDRPRNTDRSRNFIRNRNMQYQDTQSSQPPPMGTNPPNQVSYQQQGPTPPNQAGFMTNQNQSGYQQYNSPSPYQPQHNSPPPHQQMPNSPPLHQQMNNSPPPHHQMQNSPPPQQQMQNSPPPHQQMHNSPPPHHQMQNSPPPQQMHNSPQPNQPPFQQNQGGYPPNNMMPQSQGRYPPNTGSQGGYPQNNMAQPRPGGFVPNPTGYQQNQNFPPNQNVYQQNKDFHPNQSTYQPGYNAGQNFQNRPPSSPPNPSWSNNSRQNYQDGYSPDRD